MSWIAKLKEARKKAQERTDPWHLRLEGLKGKIWDDGIERISTQIVFDILEVPHQNCINRLSSVRVNRTA
jgi:hypothetical protein